MELISRQAVLDGIDKYIEKAQSTGTKDDFISFAELGVKALPSAFEGMTIGEVLETVFSNLVIDRVSDECPVATIRIGTEVFSCYKKWLDSPYKGVSE